MPRSKAKPPHAVAGRGSCSGPVFFAVRSVAATLELAGSGRKWVENFEGSDVSHNLGGRSRSTGARGRAERRGGEPQKGGHRPQGVVQPTTTLSPPVAFSPSLSCRRRSHNLTRQALLLGIDSPHLFGLITMRLRRAGPQTQVIMTTTLCSIRNRWTGRWRCLSACESGASADPRSAR